MDRQGYCPNTQAFVLNLISAVSEFVGGTCLTCARASKREPCPRAVELGEYRPRSCLGFSACRALGSKDIGPARWRRFPAHAHAPRLPEPGPRSSRITRYN